MIEALGRPGRRSESSRPARAAEPVCHERRDKEKEGGMEGGMEGGREDFYGPLTALWAPGLHPQYLTHLPPTSAQMLQVLLLFLFFRLGN